MAASQFQEMKSQAAVSNNSRLIEQTQRVGERVAAVVADQLPEAEWEFVVFEDPSINAFAMPGGKIGVNTGLLYLVESDDELAAVMGHEVAHVLLEHANQRMSTGVLVSAGQVAAAYGTKEMEEENRQAILAAVGLGAQVGIMLPFSRSHESQADREGLLISAKAGYDPRAAITFWQKMSAQGGESPPEYLSTHPSHDRRIRDLQSHMPEAVAVWEAHRGQ
jgi:predicted Zn-dependent protease